MATLSLTYTQICTLIESLDSYVYECAPEHATRNNGAIMDPRLDRDVVQRPLDEEEQEVADFLDSVLPLEQALHAARSSAMVEEAVGHGYRAGWDDYRDRSTDVLALADQGLAWCWPLAGADEAYIHAVGVETLCDQLMIAVSQWEAVSEAWLRAFRAGYCAAHAELGEPSVGEVA